MQDPFNQGGPNTGLDDDLLHAQELYAAAQFLDGFIARNGNYSLAASTDDGGLINGDFDGLDVEEAERALEVVLRSAYDLSSTELLQVEYDANSDTFVTYFDFLMF
ncbi:MAG: hypothetical protein WBF53_07345 [Litorimonas sp.]